MVSVASGGTAERIAVRILVKVLQAGSGTSARYSSTFFGATLALMVEPRALEFVFFIRVVPLGDKRTTNLPVKPEWINHAPQSPAVFLPNWENL